MTRPKPVPKGPLLPTADQLTDLLATPQRFERWLASQPDDRAFYFNPILYFIQDSFRWGPILERAYAVLERAYEDAGAGTGDTPRDRYPVAGYNVGANTVYYYPSETPTEATPISSGLLAPWVQVYFSQVFKDQAVRRLVTASQLRTRFTALREAGQV